MLEFKAGSDHESDKELKEPLLLRSHNNEDIIKRSFDFYKFMKKRRTIRDFSNQSVPKEVIENAILSAGSAPNGANKQPWKFVAIESLKVKKRLQVAVEAVEKEFYSEKTPQTWLNDLKQFGTNSKKSYITKAPYIIAIFSQIKGEKEGEKTYYPIESTGIATGILLTALHTSGLATLTHTPRPMRFLNDLLNVNDCFRPFMLVVTGYPKLPLNLPDIEKKSLNEISKFI